MDAKDNQSIQMLQRLLTMPKGRMYHLLHSNYLDFKGVQIEQMEQSAVFKSYSRFYITELSTNETLLRSWITGKEIPIIK